MLPASRCIRFFSADLYNRSIERSNFSIHKPLHTSSEAATFFYITEGLRTKSRKINNLIGSSQQVPHSLLAIRKREILIAKIFEQARSQNYFPLIGIVVTERNNCKIGR